MAGLLAEVFWNADRLGRESGYNPEFFGA